MVALSDGSINFYESTGELITTYAATHVVTEFAFDGAELPLLATAGQDGTVLTHNMTLWRNGVMLVGRRPKSVVVPGEFTENGSPKRKKAPPPTEQSANGFSLVINLENVASPPEECSDKVRLGCESDHEMKTTRSLRS